MDEVQYLHFSVCVSISVRQSDTYLLNNTIKFVCPIRVHQKLSINRLNRSTVPNFLKVYRFSLLFRLSLLNIQSRVYFHLEMAMQLESDIVSHHHRESAI